MKKKECIHTKWHGRLKIVGQKESVGRTKYSKIYELKLVAWRWQFGQPTFSVKPKLLTYNLSSRHEAAKQRISVAVRRKSLGKVKHFRYCNCLCWAISFFGGSCVFFFFSLILPSLYLFAVCFYAHLVGLRRQEMRNTENLTGVMLEFMAVRNDSLKKWKSAHTFAHKQNRML